MASTEDHRRALIVDDEIIFAINLEADMHELGFDFCDLAANGQQASMLAMSNQPDVVLMDINLEGAAKASRPLGGFAVCARHLSFSSRAILIPTPLIPTPSRASVSKFLEPACYLKRLIAATLPQPWQRSAIAEQSDMATPDRFIAWCKQEQASIEQQSGAPASLQGAHG